jgi:NAD-dependent dihydropyrimidine dehydrogenase PreA subunit
VFGEGSDLSTVGVEQPYQCVVGCSNCRDLCPQKAIAFPDLEAIAGLIRELRRESGGGS